MENPNSAEWEPPPPPEKIEVETAQMSEVAALGNVFLEPGPVFEDMRKKPRFLIGALIMALLITAFSFAMYYKVGEQNLRTFYGQQIDKSPQASSMDNAARTGMIEMYMTIGTVVRYVMPVIVLVFLALGGLYYWLASKAFGGTGNYLHGLSVWVYSSFPPAIVAMVANFIILAFKSADDIDIAASQSGVVHANLGFFIDGKSRPIIATLLGAFDVFLIWGWVLAAIGLRKTQKISSGSAWAITIILALVGIGFKLIGAFFSGNPS